MSTQNIYIYECIYDKRILLSITAISEEVAIIRLNNIVKSSLTFKLIKNG